MIYARMSHSGVTFFQSLGRTEVIWPFAFLQEHQKVLLVNSVVLAQIPFRLIPKVITPIAMILFIHIELAIVHAIVLELRHIRRVVGSIRTSDAISHNSL